MKFDMTRPCPECPFTRGPNAVRLTDGRIEEIAGMMLDRQGGTFPCHKTVYKEEGVAPTSEQTHCAGALIFAEKNGNATQIMRIMERIGSYDHTKLDMEADVFDDMDEMLATSLDRKVG